jgi:hypothetical protein
MHPMKKCNKCKETLDYSKFAKNRTKKDGYENYCKSCKNVYNKQNYGNKFVKIYLKKGGYGIYKVENIITGEYYIGKGWLNERKVDHFTKLKAQKHSNPYLQKSYNNVEHKHLKFSILEKCEMEFGSERERYYLINAFLKDPNKLLNQHITIKWE